MALVRVIAVMLRSFPARWLVVIVGHWGAVVLSLEGHPLGDYGFAILCNKSLRLHLKRDGA